MRGVLVAIIATGILTVTTALGILLAVWLLL
jgi:hypothetical protein